jgi:hypothetical protein
MCIYTKCMYVVCSERRDACCCTLDHLLGAGMAARVVVTVGRLEQGQALLCLLGNVRIVSNYLLKRIYRLICTSVLINYHIDLQINQISIKYQLDKQYLHI